MTISSVDGEAALNTADWSADELRQAGKLLMSLREIMIQSGIRSIHDPRISLNVRRLWQRLIDSKALDTLSCKEIGLLWSFVELPKPSETRRHSAKPRTAVASRRDSTDDAPAPPRRAQGRGGSGYSADRFKPRQQEILGAGWMM